MIQALRAVCSNDPMRNCAQSGREYEVFALHADEDPASVSRLAALVLAAKQHTWLTIATKRPARATAAVEAAGLQLLHRSEWLMTADLPRHPHRALESAYACDIRSEGCATMVEIASADGQRLYSALGWKHLADVVIAQVPVA